MRTLITILITLSVTFVILEVQANTLPQTPPPQAAPTAAKPDPDKLADEFLKRYNALDSWHLTPEGKEEGREQAVSSFMELLTPDILADVPPHDEEQLGSVMLRGSDLVRKWVDKISSSHVRLNFIRTAQTRKDVIAAYPVYFTEYPWGGYGIAYQIIGAWSMRDDRLGKRYMAPGMVVIQYNPDGKIYRFRLYLTEIQRVVAG